MTREQIKKELGRLNISQKIILWNEYSENGCLGREIFRNDDEFLETYLPDSKEFSEKARQGDYRKRDKYVSFDGYENLQSFNNIKDLNSPYSTDELVTALEKGWVKFHK